MRVSYLWLKDYVDFNLPPSQLAELLTMAGLEVENVEPVGPELEGIYVGLVEEVRPHPQADKLTLCRVNLGDRSPEVVCGAPNVAAGQKIAFIAAGTSLPDGTLIEARSIRGVRSEGMICSGKELGLSEDLEGILVLDPSAEIGKPLRDVLGPRDWALDLEVTLNRADCLSHFGVAREIAAMLARPLRFPEIQVRESQPRIETLTSVEVLEPAYCPRYSARVMLDVNIGPSPDWMRHRLEAAGLRSINNVVDVTNYVMLELGHPMHAFDLDRLEGGRIVVRCAAKGEKFVTLDGQERLLDDKMLLICDASRGVALAGVMGGANSEISDQTTRLLLESAYFDPINTRRTSRLLGLATDSSRRFERGADPNATTRALDRAAQLIAQTAGGRIAAGIADVYPRQIKPKVLRLRSSRVQAILGTKVPKVEISDHLTRLGCTVRDAEAGELNVMTPTFRPDLEREIDLIEEVARLHGYNRIPLAESARIPLEIPSKPVDAFKARLAQIMTRLGFAQIVTSSLLSKAEVHVPGYPAAVPLRNAGSEDMAYLRNGLLPGLLKTAAYNINRGMPDLRLFEIGRVFQRDPSGDQEWDAVAGLICGLQAPNRWDRRRDAVNFLDLKGFVEEMLREISLDKLDFFYYNIEHGTGDALAVKSADRELGWLEQVRPSVARAFDVEIPVFCFEFHVDQLEEETPPRVIYRPFSKFPFIQRDLAFVVAEDVAAGDVEKRIRKSGKELLVHCELFDVYRGAQIEAGKKSLAFRLIFQSPERTLQDQEADRLVAGIVKMMTKEFGAALRA